MLGVICALLWRDASCKVFLARNAWIMSACLGIFGLGVAILTYRRWGMGTLPMCTLGFSCMALFYASALMTTMIDSNGWLSRVCQTRWLMRLGGIAYGLYLIHGLVLELAFRILRHRAPILANGYDALTALLALILAVFFAQLSWRFFESKLVRMGHRFTYGTARAVRPAIPN